MRVTLSRERIAVWRALLTIHVEATERINDALAAAHVLSLAEYDVLLTLYEAEGKRLRLSDLARAVLLTRSGTTRLIDRLEAQNLLVREACATDRRGTFAVLTDAGVNALRRTWPVYADNIARHFADYLTDEEVEVFTRATTRILDALSNTPADVSPAPPPGNVTP